MPGEGQGQGQGQGDDPARLAVALVARLTLQEKVDQLQNHAPAIPRLGIPAYDWWNESLHGVARNGRATVFPQAIGLGATFDEDLLGRVARAIADEARAKLAVTRSVEGDTDRYQGLTFFAPNVNILRDPRWGRGQETYGEDPFLTSRLAVAYVRGLQGQAQGQAQGQGREPEPGPGPGPAPASEPALAASPRYLRAAAVAKHFAAHSGPELTRHAFDARVEAHDLADTYLPQFEAVVREAGVAGIMAAYNRINGVPCVTSATLLGEVLRKQWGFQGFVVGDCGAVQDVVTGHRTAIDEMHAAAQALRAGTDLDCGDTYRHLTDAVAAGLITEGEIDRAAARLFAVRFRLGLLGFSGGAEAEANPNANPNATHLALAREAAQKSLVLLTNGGVLPVGAAVHRIAVLGPLADDVEVLLGNYHGEPTAPVTLLAGIEAAARGRGISVQHAEGVGLTGRSLAGLVPAVALAQDADLVIAVLGLSAVLEGEEGDPAGQNPAGDRQDLGLPGAQPALLAALLRTGKPTVVILTGGGALALPQSVRPPDAVLVAWYPGEQGGNAVADVLFGDVAPSGRLPITFYRSIKDLPPFTDYGMRGRTYRYFEGKPLFPFGHGLTYSQIAYREIGATLTPSQSSSSFPSSVHVHAVIENRGHLPVEEVVQVFARPHALTPGDPSRSLVAFRRVSVSAGQQQAVGFELASRTFTRVDRQGHRQPVGGSWDLIVGGLSVTVELPP